jgi:Flp pilus assembly pilin Flp
VRTIGANMWAAVVKVFRDEKSNVHVEYGIIVALIALLIGAWGDAVARNDHAAFSAAAVPAGVSVATDGWASKSPFAERHYRIRDLSERWALSRETVRQVVKDDPGVAKIRHGRKKACTTYSIPESAARRIHSRFWGLESAFDEQHYRIADLASLWAVGRETVRLMIKDEPGVLKVRLGRKRAHTTYSVPASVAKRIHNRLLYAA